MKPAVVVFRVLVTRTSTCLQLSFCHIQVQHSICFNKSSQNPFSRKPEKKEEEKHEKVCVCVCVTERKRDGGGSFSCVNIYKEEMNDVF